MNEHNLIEIFFKELKELYESFDNIFESSFKSEIVEENTSLIKERRYAIVDEVWKIDQNANNEFLISFLDLIKKNAPEFRDEIKDMRKIFNRNKKISEELINNILKNRYREILDFSMKYKFSNDFLTFFSIFSAYGYRNSVTKFIENDYDLESHISGLCPVCGHWPGISYIIGDKGTRKMACICCGAVWRFKRLTCSFCLTSNKNSLSYLNVEGEDIVSAYTCDNCSRYLKTVRSEKETTDLPNEKPLIDFMNSGFIDIAAIQNKYVQDSILRTKYESPYDKHLDEYIAILVSNLDQ